MELLEIVDENDSVIGVKSRAECHGNPQYTHRVAHVLLFNSSGELLLQKRSMKKDLEPGKWDSSVGGHLEVGESYLQAALREMQEELGIEGHTLEELYQYQYRDEIQSQNVASFKTVWDGDIEYNKDEIDQVSFWTINDIQSKLGSGIFTPSFEQEFNRYIQSAASK